MAYKTGCANLPLHYGRVPQWLADRMAKLGAIKRLDTQARKLEQHIKAGPTVDDIITHEREVSSQYGGRSIYGEE